MLFRTFIILLVEDNPADIRLVEEAFKESDINTELIVVKDGVEAMEFLTHSKNHEDAPIPDLILLDLNLPRKDGREVLKEIKEDKNLKHIPVVILTTSSTEEDIYETYAHHANSYIVKPANVGRFIETMKNLEDYWFNMLKLP
ncbi:response regulator [Methanobacterium sp. ACI-7]|uniref:response regulator n=1 Tax=unclassified Methanobacterium TaxID=2627676 RepID=UPI0039C0236A